MTDHVIQRILIPTDLSDFSRGALAWGGLFRKAMGSSLTVLYANEPYVPVDVIDASAALAIDSSAAHEKFRKELRSLVAEQLPEAAADIATLVVDDTPSRAIVSTAKKLDVDLILMGTHGRTGWSRAFLGSVTEAVVHHSDRRVMSVPGKEFRPQVKTIVCPVNFTDIGRMAVEEAGSLAEEFGADLVIVYVATPFDEPFMDSLEQELAAWIEPGIRARCRYSQVVSRGDAAEQVLKLADQVNADLIVIGAQHKRFTDASVIGTTTERVVRFARRPVWTVVSPVRPRLFEHDRDHVLVAR